jgi:chemotaxis response regulator CheB
MAKARAASPLESMQVSSLRLTTTTVVVQDAHSPATAGMPLAMMATGCVDLVLPLERVAVAFISLVMAPAGSISSDHSHLDA